MPKRTGPWLLGYYQISLYTSLLEETSQDVPIYQHERRGAWQRKQKSFPTTQLAQEDNTADAHPEGESPLNINTDFLLFMQAPRKGNFGLEQHEDVRLKHCWGQVLEMGAATEPPASSFSGTLNHGRNVDASGPLHQPRYFLHIKSNITNLYHLSQIAS